MDTQTLDTMSAEECGETIADIANELVTRVQRVAQLNRQLQNHNETLHAIKFDDGLKGDRIKELERECAFRKAEANRMVAWNIEKDKRIETLEHDNAKLEKERDLLRDKPIHEIREVIPCEIKDRAKVIMAMLNKIPTRDVIAHVHGIHNRSYALIERIAKD